MPGDTWGGVAIIGRRIPISLACLTAIDAVGLLPVSFYTMGIPLVPSILLAVVTL